MFLNREQLKAQGQLQNKKKFISLHMPFKLQARLRPVLLIFVMKLFYRRAARSQFSYKRVGFALLDVLILFFFFKRSYG